MGEPTNSGGYDYKKLRRRILKSWGEPTPMETPGPAEKAEGRRPPAGEKPVAPENPLPKVHGKQESSAKSFNYKKKSDKIETRTVKPDLKKLHPSAVIVADEKEARAKELSGEADRNYGGSTLQETGGVSENRLPFPDTRVARQWVLYDAVFGPPRSKRPWKPWR